MIQAIVLSIILVEVTADKVGEMDKAWVNEGGRGIAKDDRLEFDDWEEGGELDEVRDELEPAGRGSKCTRGEGEEDYDISYFVERACDPK